MGENKNDDNILTIKQYFEKGTFVIPNYQRGYKWGVEEKGKSSSLVYFIESLIKAYNDNLKKYFIEAVTVVTDSNNIILVDGQQRTTSLFLLFYQLGELDFIKGKLKYDVREDSDKYLHNLISNDKRIIDDENTQDIYYFKQATTQIEQLTNSINKNKFSSFIKTNVNLLYNVIPKEKATSTFIALNGLKAIIKDEELIKSDLLIKSSRIEDANKYNQNELSGIEWKINEDRGRLARNWDKWLYWWNQKDVKDYFGIGKQHPLHYLLITYWNINQENKKEEINYKKLEFSFNHFKNEFISDYKNAKLHFEGLRKLQKTFEDLFNDTTSHNFLGLILKTSNSNNKETALCYFLNSKITEKISIKNYAKWALVKATHLEIVNTKVNENEPNAINAKTRKAAEAINLLNEKYVYWNENDKEHKDDERKEFAYKFLLLLNLLEDNNLNRKFNFSIWNNRSLEHIYPKSKKVNLDFTTHYQESSIHCIGNLVLLYGNDNSSFGALEFDKKKNKFFKYFMRNEDDLKEKELKNILKSNTLLHTISVFANDIWDEVNISRNKTKTINSLKEYYGID